MPTVTVVDYGMGNLRSVAKAFESVGSNVNVTDAPTAIAAADRLVLPGVGAFRDAIARLRDERVVEPILEFIRSGRPFLGICLGLQMLFEKSYEDGEFEGLGVLAGDVVRFGEEGRPGIGVKVPHMGWNNIDMKTKAPIFEGLPDRPSVYFVHSYFVRPTDPTVVAATADHAGVFTAAVWKENITATQFHPEKSQAVGLAMLRNFALLKTV